MLPNLVRYLRAVWRGAFQMCLDTCLNDGRWIFGFGSAPTIEMLPGMVNAPLMENSMVSKNIYIEK